MQKGMNMSAVRAKNRSLILRDLLENGPLSRKDLAASTGLTQASLTQICNEFLEDGILRETGEVRSETGAGRKKILLEFNRGYQYILAVTIEPEWTRVVLSDIGGNPSASKRRRTDSSMEAEEWLNLVAQDCLHIEEEAALAVREKIAGVSVAVSGRVDEKEGVSVHAYGIWKKEVPVRKILEGKLGLPVLVENNVDAFAVAETVFGSGKEDDDLLVIKWGPGVGAAAVIGHELYAGHYRKAAEIGHFIVEKNGRKCSCGRRGCLETRASYPALSSIVPFEMEDFGITYARLKKEEPGSATLQKIEEAMDLFARTIVNSVTVLAPGRVILCGRMFADERVRRKVIEDCESYAGKEFGSIVDYTVLAEKEDFIGPVAVYLGKEFLQGGSSLQLVPQKN